ncbi:MAG: ABC transporter permease [Geminicoccaceae bacterium]|nr:ABC transporter permease [Geminicoccaceae bacterium]MCS7267146.1 ABC transporter permease [Geminicoccaceae bacterium]MCX7629960.1 ABC transporter permease [Geminicoccaceae bacterium]MDW8341543.1 ABC transporter permease [Geminicoccaceae bacterium]
MSDLRALRLSLRRIRAVFRRHAYLLLASWPRLFELVYWPAVQMLLWGYLTLFLQEQSGLVARASGIFLSAVLLWDTLFRGQLGVAICFLEEMYARHLAHLFVSPLRPFELVIAVFGISFLRVAIGVGGAALLAVPIFGFVLPRALGWALLPYFAVLLMFGWAIGLVIVGLVLRLGLAAENLAWGAIFLVQPISGVYYPVATLPAFLQPIAWCLPSSAIFEGMRAVLVEGRFDTGLLAWALVTLTFWLAGGAVAFVALFRSARRLGLLLQVGE